MKKYAVYLHLRADNGRVFYVGCCARQDARRASGVKKYQRAFDFGQRKPGWFDVMKAAGGVRVEIIFTSDIKAEAYKVEADLVASYGRANFDNGLLVNECAGGRGAPKQHNSEMTKLKKSINQRGRSNSMYGKRGAETGTARRVVDIESGQLYESVSEAATAFGHKMKTLYNWLSGHRPNPTKLRFSE